MKNDETKLLHNTRVLLHALGGGLRSHIEKSVTSTEELEALEIVALLSDRDPDVYMDALCKSRTRTEILLVHTEQLFSAWKESSKSGVHRQRLKIIHEWYFEKKGLSQIARKLNRTETIILAQLGIAVEELSVYFFGKDGL